MRDLLRLLRGLVLVGSCAMAQGPYEIRSLTITNTIAAGEAHSVAIAWDGTVWEWGGSSLAPSRPHQVIGLSGATAVAASSNYSLALKNDGSVWQWGIGAAPSVVDGLAEIVAVAASTHAKAVTDLYPSDEGLHGLALKSDGTVWTWAELGPATQIYGLTGVVAIAGGYDHQLALRNDGTVWAWGSNTCGQSGNASPSGWNEPADWILPRQVAGISAAVAISAGGGEHFFSFGHSLALKGDGTVWEWGCNGTGEVQPTPRQVGELPTILRIAAGGEHSLTLKDDGTIWTWGWNYYGQLGDGSRTYGFGPESVIAAPVQVSNLCNVRELAGGEEHSLALTGDGSVWAWGFNSNGQLGDGTTTNRSAPIQVSGLPPVLLPGLPGERARRPSPMPIKRIIK